jgi:hypothetical protein
MAICPLIQKDCLQDNCEWWSEGISKCGLMGIGLLLEGLHDMAAMTFQEYVGVIVQEDEEDEELMDE